MDRPAWPEPGAGPSLGTRAGNGHHSDADALTTDNWQLLRDLYIVNGRFLRRLRRFFQAVVHESCVAGALVLILAMLRICDDLDALDLARCMFVEVRPSTIPLGDGTSPRR